MATEEENRKVLEYLQKQGPINTFRLARELEIDRSHLLHLIKKLESQACLEFKSGTVRFLSFPLEEKKVVPVPRQEVKEIPPIKIITHKHRKPSQKALKERALLKDITSENEKLKQKLYDLETNFKTEMSNKENSYNEKLRDQLKYITQLEKKNNELQKQEASKLIPKTKRLFGNITESLKGLKKDIRLYPQIKEKFAEFKKMRLPRFGILKRSISQLKQPEFMSQKLKMGEINFGGLHKNIQQLQIPEIFKKGW